MTIAAFHAESLPPFEGSRVLLNVSNLPVRDHAFGDEKWHHQEDTTGPWDSTLRGRGVSGPEMFQGFTELGYPDFLSQCIRNYLRVKPTHRCRPCRLP